MGTSSPRWAPTWTTPLLNEPPWRTRCLDQLPPWNFFPESIGNASVHNHCWMAHAQLALVRSDPPRELYIFSHGNPPHRSRAEGSVLVPHVPRHHHRLQG